MSVAADNLHELIADFAESVNEVLAQKPTIENGVDVLNKIQDMRRLLAVAADEVESFLVDTLPGGTYIVEGVEGVAAVERKTATKRNQWDHEMVFRDLAKKMPDNRLTNEETGEIESEAEAMLRIIKEAANPSWRTTVLKQYGLAADEYCKVEYGAPSIKVTKA